MFLSIIVAFLGIMGLLILHEFGHFIAAKKFGADVEEFGIGYPPRIFGKKIGKVVYSLNAIPFGAFVNIKGETGGVEDYRSFSGKPIWQRVLIVLGGVISFWLISAVLLAMVSWIWGLPFQVSDEETGVKDPMVQIAGVQEESPAQKAGIQIGDIVLGAGKEGEERSLNKIIELQSEVKESLGEEMILTVKRDGEVLRIPVVPDGKNGEAVIGVSLSRVALKSFPWYEAPWQGIRVTGLLTANIVKGWVMGLKSLFGVQALPAGMKFEMMGPLGIFDMLRNYFSKGASYFLYLVSLISVALALANILPIPALDGGKMVFLMIEAARKKPVPSKIEQRITSVFFVLLIIMMVYVTFKFDIPRTFLE